MNYPKTIYISSYTLEAQKRKLCSLEPEGSVASGGFLNAKISLLSSNWLNIRLR